MIKQELEKIYFDAIESYKNHTIKNLKDAITELKNSISEKSKIVIRALENLLQQKLSERDYELKNPQGLYL